MKKFLVALLSVMMVLSMAACGKPAPKPLADDTHAAWVAHGQYLLADGTPNGWNGKDTALYEASEGNRQEAERILKKQKI